MAAANSCKCVLAAASDVDALMELQFVASENDEYHRAIWGSNTLANRRAAADRFLEKWQTNPDTFHVVKCLDSATGELMAFCVWEVIGRKASREEALEEDCMNNCNWLQGQERAVARAYLIDGLEEHWNVMQGASHAYLTNLCTSHKSRKRGAATALVTWGLQLANSRGIPAYCETSDMSYNLYLKLGFREVATIKSMLNGELFSTCPVVMKDPDKVAAS